MYKNIGKKIHILAIILAALFGAGFLAAAVIFLLAALKAEGGTTARTAGLEGAGLFLGLAVLSPLCSFALYGFGSLVDAAERQAEQEKDIRDMLKKALSDGALSDEIARKLGNSLSRLTVAAAPAPRSGVAPTRPVVRGSAKPAEPPVRPAPARQEPVLSPEQAPVTDRTPQEPAKKTAEPAAPVTPAADSGTAPAEKPAIRFTAPEAAKPAPALKDDPERIGTPVRPLHSDTTY